MILVFCSTIIPTIGRPTLERAVQSVLDQELDAGNFEVIVVNDSGKALPNQRWMKSDRVRLIHTNQHNRSVARNTGAAIAQGQFLHFLDDDDWMCPGAFQSLYGLTCQSADKIGWLYGSFRLVENNEETLVEIHPAERGNSAVQLLASEWIPLQASLINSEAFFEVGGFEPLHKLLGGYEDIHLCREIANLYDLAHIEEVVVCIRFGDQGSTTRYNNMLNQNRQSREIMLASDGTFVRLKTSAAADPACPAYWYGRIVYYYLASVRWNIQHRRLFVAASRAAYSMAALVSARRAALSARFWQGLLGGAHNNLVSRTTHQYADRLFPNTKWLG